MQACSARDRFERRFSGATPGSAAPPFGAPVYRYPLRFSFLPGRPAFVLADGRASRLYFRVVEGCIIRNIPKAETMSSTASLGGALQLATSYPAIVGAVLVNLREQQGLTQADLARRMALAPSTWSRIENGASAFSIVQLAQVAHLLDVRPWEIVRHADDAGDAVRHRQVRVEPERIAEKDALGLGLAVLGGAALGALIAGIAAPGVRRRYG